MFLGYWLKFFCRLLLYFALPPTIMIIVLVVSIVIGWLENSAMKIEALESITCSFSFQQSLSTNDGSSNCVSNFRNRSCQADHFV